MLDDIRTRLKRNGMLSNIGGKQDLNRTSMSDDALFTAQNFRTTEDISKTNAGISRVIGDETVASPAERNVG